MVKIPSKIMIVGTKTGTIDRRSRPIKREKVSTVTKEVMAGRVVVEKVALITIKVMEAVAVAIMLQIAGIIARIRSLRSSHRNRRKRR